MKDFEDPIVGKTDAALIFKEDGTFEIALPSTVVEDEDAIVSDHVMTVTTLAFLLDKKDSTFNELLGKALQEIKKSIEEDQ